MGLYTILDSYKFYKDSKEFREKCKVMVVDYINELWDIGIGLDDLKEERYEEKFPSTDGKKTLVECYIKYKPTQSLIDRLEASYPEALI